MLARWKSTVAIAIVNAETLEFALLCILYLFVLENMDFSTMVLTVYVSFFL